MGLDNPNSDPRKVTKLRGTKLDDSPKQRGYAVTKKLLLKLLIGGFVTMLQNNKWLERVP